MRISTVQYFHNGVNSIQSARDSLSLTQQKIASGRSILSPSEDPIRSTQILKINEELSLNEQFKANMSFAIGKNELEDSVVGSVVDALQRVRALTIQSNADSLSDADRRGIGREVEAILDQILALLNSKDGSGEHIFGGYQGANAPFVKQPGGGYEYLGDSGTRSVEVAV
ncbi:MAG: flagellar hook-associated protein FlgL, partial [Pseudomonadales bacterium]|nr:flagellar hook-associated protein FlgL [Pseudomonadales bacterium]